MEIWFEIAGVNVSAVETTSKNLTYENDYNDLADRSKDLHDEQYSLKADFDNRIEELTQQFFNDTNLPL